MAAVGLGILLLLPGEFALIAGAVLMYIQLYRFWRVIQDANPRTTPGRAVGFCFIPFFNFYWIFPAMYGLAQDMNAYMDQRGIPGRGPSPGLALTLCIVLLVVAIPYIGLLAMPVYLVFLLLVWSQFNRAAIDITASRTRG
jgi:hypothetical protein